MYEFIQECFSPVNAPFSAMLAFMALYWLLVIFGALGADALDIDLDLDADVGGDVDLDVGADLDVDADMDAGADAGHGAIHGVLIGFLRFFNIGEVPLMIVLSLFFLSLWMLSVTSHHLLHITNPVHGLLVFGPNILAATLITKAATAPLAKLFRKLDLNSGKSYENLVGKTCTVKSLEVSPKHGQAILNEEGTTVLLNVCGKEEEKLVQGDCVLIVEHDREHNVYDVIKFNDLE
ncbi:MAG: YqiJ family protein [Planctomycetales bacterium]